MDGNEDEDLLYSRIITLSDNVWEKRVRKPDILAWLANFSGQLTNEADERFHALYLLSHFNHFGAVEIRQLLRSMFRDHIRYPIIQSVRAKQNWTQDYNELAPEIEDELAATRFLPMGNPSESGSHLLYYFRQENGLSKHDFLYPHELFKGADRSGERRGQERRSDRRRPRTYALTEVTRLVFIDDICSSGQQACQYGMDMLPEIRESAAAAGLDVEILYCVLFGNTDGMALAHDAGFDDVRAVFELDESQRAFHANSRVYSGATDGIKVDDGRALAEHYGSLLDEDDPLGYCDSQLMLGLHHNVPDNTLPIFWDENQQAGWVSIFQRRSKF